MVVGDNSSTYCSVTLVVLIATQVTLPAGTTGPTRSSVLEPVASRPAFSSDL